MVVLYHQSLSSGLNAKISQRVTVHIIGYILCQFRRFCYSVALQRRRGAPEESVSVSCWYGE